MADEPKTVPEKSRADILFERLWRDKTPTGVGVRKIAKELFNDIDNPDEQGELYVAPVKAELDATNAKLKEVTERLAAREKADEDLKFETEISMKIANAVRAFGLTDSGRDKMMARMKETGNYSDADAAAAWVVSQTPKPAPTNTPSWMPEASNLFGSQNKDEQFESLHKDPRKYLDDQLREFVRDPDKYTADTFGNA